MKLQKIGGIGSIGTAILIVIILVIITIVFPNLGLFGPSDWNDPIKNFDAMSASPITFFIFNLDFILFSIASILVVLALRERMYASAPNLMRLAMIGISISCGLWLATGIIGIVGMPSIVSAKDISAFRALRAVHYGMGGVAGYFTHGWTLLLIGWAALKTISLPRILSYLFVLAGIVNILEFVVQPLMFVAILLGIVWGLWLGIVLLRSKT
jgi:hypothetical protein